MITTVFNSYKAASWSKRSNHQPLPHPLLGELLPDKCAATPAPHLHTQPCHTPYLILLAGTIFHVPTPIHPPVLPFPLHSHCCIPIPTPLTLLYSHSHSSHIVVFPFPFTHQYSHSHSTHTVLGSGVHPFGPQQVPNDAEMGPWDRQMQWPVSLL